MPGTAEAPDEQARDEFARRISTGSDGETEVEWVDLADIAVGDELLVYPGETIAVDGTLHEPSEPDALEAAGAPRLLGAGRGTATTPAIAIESVDGERRRAVVGGGVRAGETVHNGAAVVEVGRRGRSWLPVAVAVLTSLFGLNKQSLARVAVGVVVVGVVLAGTGLGATSSFDDFVRENSERIGDIVNGGWRLGGGGTPLPPSVEVTPPEPTAAPDGSPGTGTPAQPPEGTPGETPTPTESPTATPNGTEPEGTATETPEPTATEQSSGDRRNSGGGGDSAAPVSATLDLTAGDPGEIQNGRGTVDSVRGPVSGTLRWTGTVDSVVLVVQSWVPGQGWGEVRRVSASGTSPVPLADALGETTYATGGRAAAFENPENGTTRQTAGNLAVTAVLFNDGTEVARTQATDGFTVTVTNVGAVTPPLELQLGGGAGRTNVFDFGDGAGADGVVVPGTDGVNRVTLTNGGARNGVLELASVEYTSYENGLTGPEAAVDATGGDPGSGAGELHESLEIRASLVSGNGSSRYVVGDETTYRSIASLANATASLGALGAGDSVDLVVEFRVPASAGNEIQSDTIVVDFRFRLVGTD